MQTPQQDFDKFVRGIPAMQRRVLRQSQSTALTFFDNSFQRQGFTDRIYIPWAKRKTAGQSGKDDNNFGARLGRRTQGRAIGTQSGALRRSGIGGVNAEGIWISYGNQQVRYAGAFNRGKKGPEPVKAHRRTSRTGRSYQVKSFTREANQPARPIIGNSQVLMQQLSQIYISELRHLKAQAQGRIPRS